MKLIYIIGLALGLGLGAASQASATGSCKTNGGGYSCDVGGTNYNVANATSESAALAAAIQFQAQQQAQQQSQTSTNTATGGNATGGNATATGGNSSAVATNGGNTVSIDNRTPGFTKSANFGVNIGATIVLFGGVQTNNDLTTAQALIDVGKKCDGMRVIYNTPSAKRAGLTMPSCGPYVAKGEQPAPVCYMDKDGVIHVSATTDRKACLASHGF